MLTATEIAVPLLCGSMAALLTAFMMLPLQIPGHAIIRSVFPMALGLALVPRHGTGLCMAGGALGTLWCLRVTSLATTGAGAATSLLATGPLLDLALLGARSGWQLYLGIVVAGIASNLVAFVVRGGFKALLPVPLEGRHYADWLGQAAFTYPLCGAVAGLASALIWFRWHVRPEPPEGTARSIGQTVTAAAWKSLGSRAGGEILTDD